jgi:hypothetical protein
MLIAAGGCGGDDSSTRDGENGKGAKVIPLETLVQGVNSDYGRIDELPIPDDAPPECLVITDEEELQLLLSQAYIEDPVEDVDFDRYIVLAAMQGPKNTGGYAISIMHASQTGTEIRVEVDVVEPEPGSMTAQVLTSPYHLVSAERSDFAARGELFFSFVNGDNVLISQAFAEI